MLIIKDIFVVFTGYFIEVLPALIIGFILSGVIQEFIRIELVKRYFGEKGIIPVLYATIIGIFLPLCCIGALPVAISFYKKGAHPGPVLAFLVATPATSITALLVSYRILGLKFTIFIFFTVILIGLVIGIVGNFLKFKPNARKSEVCPECAHDKEICHCGEMFQTRMKNVLRYSFIDMPKEMGVEMLVGLILAALVAVIVPVGQIINTYLAGGFGYLFALAFGLLTYICSTASIPLVDALVNQGMNIGAGMTLLLVGPITNYGTILVMRKEFGWKILLIYLGVISFLSLALGYMFSLIQV